MNKKDLKHLIQEEIQKVLGKSNFDPYNDSDTIRNIFTKATGLSAYDDMDNYEFDDEEGTGWRFDLDSAPISDQEKTKLMIQLVQLAEKNGWKYNQWGDDAIDFLYK
jgi:hypothetical protein